MVSQRRTSKIIERKVVYPVFLKCAAFTLDRFYIDLLTNCAHGDFPKGVRVNRGFLYVVVGRGKYITLDLTTDPQELNGEIIRHFRDDLNLCSSHESKKIMKTYEELVSRYTIQRNLPWGRWTKQMKCDSISEYVCKIARSKNLTELQKLELYVVINTGLLFKYISSTDIKCRNGKITHIKGIFSKNGNYYYKPKGVKSAVVVKKAASLAAMWESHIASIMKRYKEFSKV